jgi:hypothetical protein
MFSHGIIAAGHQLPSSFLAASVFEIYALLGHFSSSALWVGSLCSKKSWVGTLYSWVSFLSFDSWVDSLYSKNSSLSGVVFGESLSLLVTGLICCDYPLVSRTSLCPENHSDSHIH